ncbi:SGNH/GDSL hydrolase family protein [Candidatus Nitrospira allomarina]|uniref:SGNH hydrolase-type esterase domain-containing protein n=1 Tax=Candidatus Nitrospira allomarina TaxID=3020900 RepID=A0AA96GIC1_9BACT|nr:hypothetical protein [Candidatus Nitrospira allomarina]WNM58241.1 hypothetical protein PP769_00345 [Candidatus Nitrospira allomarina]
MARRETSLNLLLLVISVICALVVSEVVLRALSHKDIDGNVYIGKLRLRPFFLPVKSLVSKSQEFYGKRRPYNQYDPDLGWSVRPNSQSENGLYASNAAGVRVAQVGQEITQEAPPAIFRIAILGDSFTHGDDVPFEVSWGAILENSLNRNGIKAEVLNLGGQGYGIDQAFLRWKKHGKLLKPHLVLFGFQHSNIKRNMNIIRMFYSPDSDVIFSKPRFILSPVDTLNLLNTPTVKPEDIITIYSDFDQWPLKPYELFYQEDDYKMSPWYASRLVAFIISGLTNNFSSRRKDYDFFADESPSRRLTEEIIEEFEREVLEEQSRFIIVHLPTKSSLQNLLNGEPLKYQKLLDDLSSKYDLIDPAFGLIAQTKEDSLEGLFAKNSSHYSLIANGVVGEWIATALLNHNKLRMFCCENESEAFPSSGVLPENSRHNRKTSPIP